MIILRKVLILDLENILKLIFSSWEFVFIFSPKGSFFLSEENPDLRSCTSSVMFIEGVNNGQLVFLTITLLFHPLIRDGNFTAGNPNMVGQNVITHYRGNELLFSYHITRNSHSQSMFYHFYHLVLFNIIFSTL